jgi:L-threonylcarbamoyladenylate synthase
VIVHLFDIAQIKSWATEVPAYALRLAERFWPGPLTLILRRSASVLAEVTGGQDSVALRLPSHPLSRQLLQAFDSGIAAPSANKFGRLSPTTIQAVRQELGADVEVFLDGGPCEVGIESTIVDCTNERPRILRPGMILPDEIQVVAGLPKGLYEASAPVGKRVPGSLPSHYAPRTSLALVATNELDELVALRQSEGQRVCVLSFRPPRDTVRHSIVASPEPPDYARHLYAHLRKLDCQGGDLIVVEDVPDDERWAGIRDRLKRAAYNQVG